MNAIGLGGGCAVSVGDYLLGTGWRCAAANLLTFGARQEILLIGVWRQ